MTVAAAIPACESAATLPRVLVALRAQAPTPDDLLIVDDASTFAPTGARVISHATNLGRGATRATIMRETTAPLVLMCDATLALALDFTARALPWFDEPRVGAVFGHITQPAPRTTAERWRGRHLFKTTPPLSPNHSALLATGACVLRRAAVEDAGGFDASLRSGEDADLGRRLLARGWQVVADPALSALDLRTDTAHTALARYARWNSPDGLPPRSFLRQLAYALKVMVRDDLRARDPLAALLSLAAPFYQLRRR